MRQCLARRLPTLHGLASAYAVVLSLLLLYGGVGHTIAVIAVHFRQGRAYDYRFATLVGIGGILILSAVTNLVLARWIAQGRPWALAWSFTPTAAVVAYTLLLLPLPAARDAAGPALVLNAGYVVVVTLGLLNVKNTR